MSTQDSSDIAYPAIVSRICLERALPSNCSVKQRLKLKLFFSDEFKSPIKDERLEAHQFHYDFIRKGSLFTSWQVGRPLESHRVADASSHQVTLSCPMDTGEYYLVVSSSSRSVDGCTVLPFMSDGMAISSSAASGDEVQLTCYRYLPIWDHDDASKTKARLFIKEEYGAAMGSHIYDCSIVLIHYLRCFIPEVFGDEAQRSVAMELGAGCGLVSTWLSKLFHHTISTDKQCQLTLLSENVEFNRAGDTVHVEALTWDNCQEIESLIERYGSLIQDLKLLIAGDVFYARESISQFFKLVSRFISLSSDVVVIVGQKLRFSPVNQGTTSSYKRQYQDLISLFKQNCSDHLFICEPVFEEADVVVWRLCKTSC
jgi:hypothetical protein